MGNYSLVERWLELDLALCGFAVHSSVFLQLATRFSMSSLGSDVVVFQRKIQLPQKPLSQQIAVIHEFGCHFMSCPLRSKWYTMQLTRIRWMLLFFSDSSFGLLLTSFRFSGAVDYLQFLFLSMFFAGRSDWKRKSHAHDQWHLRMILVHMTWSWFPFGLFAQRHCCAFRVRILSQYKFTTVFLSLGSFDIWLFTISFYNWCLQFSDNFVFILG